MKNYKLFFFAVAILSLNIACNSKIEKQPDALRFDVSKYEIQTAEIDGETIEVRAYENIVYIKKPVDTVYQIMNIYIPRAYFEGKTINGYSADTAPIFFPNQVGGYMPGKPGTFIMKSSKDPSPKVNTIAQALARGYVVASPGARGRTSPNGKAPSVIIDLKAAVRYLKFNDQIMPGNAAKIISNGTSAGGAVSALLGATGDASEYDTYLAQIGAATASDAIFAVSAYCPITNLDHADAAYEWQFNGVNDYKKIDISMLDYKVQRKEVAGTLDENQQQISSQLKALFPAYINHLQLKDDNGNLLTLDENGNGNFKDLVISYIVASANTAMHSGTDMQPYSFLKIENNTVIDFDFDAYVRYMERLKLPPAFDALDLSSGENQLFGNAEVDAMHFTDYSTKHNIVEGGRRTDNAIVRMMNPMEYIGKDNAKPAGHWRIRHGSKDRDTGLAIAVVLAAQLKNNGYQVDLAFPWDRPHSGDYDLPQLFDWIDRIAK
ncbi:MAG: subtype B tannase [Capnocytophaga sp.]|nr:subtype B tannase [Capnocytophaga sp.]